MDTSKLPTFDRTDWTADRFKERALRTWMDANSSTGDQILHAAMGLAGEAGETLDGIKKALYKPGYRLNPDDLVDEVGDCFYYIVVLTSLLGLTVEDLSVRNTAKLSGGQHGWQDRADDRPIDIAEAERQIREAFARHSARPQFDSVMEEVRRRLAASLGKELTLIVEDLSFATNVIICESESSLSLLNICLD